MGARMGKTGARVGARPPPPPPPPIKKIILLFGGLFATCFPC